MASPAYGAKPMEEEKKVDNQIETPQEEKKEDIDFKKELEDLEGGRQPQRTEEEKLLFNMKRIATQLEEKGIDPSEALGIKKAKKEDTADLEEKLVKSLDLRFASQEAKKLAKSDEEYNLIMWRVENQGLSVEEAHLLANKGKVQRYEEERSRMDVEAPKGGGSGQRTKKMETHEISENDDQFLSSHGFQKNADGSYEGKHIKTQLNPVTKKMEILKKNKRTGAWERPVRIDD